MQKIGREFIRMTADDSPVGWLARSRYSTAGTSMWRLIPFSLDKHKITANFGATSKRGSFTDA